MYIKRCWYYCNLVVLLDVVHQRGDTKVTYAGLTLMVVTLASADGVCGTQSL